MLALLSAVLLLLAAAPAASAAKLPRPPHRGWRSWNLFGLEVDQSLMTSIMDAMVSRARTVDGVPTSLLDLGYSDVGLDDGWQLDNSGPGGRGYHNASGYPNVNTTRFPSLAAMTAHGRNLSLTVGWYANNCHNAEAETPAPLLQRVLELENRYGVARRRGRRGGAADVR